MYFLTASDNEELEEYASLKKSGIEIFSLKIFFRVSVFKFPTGPFDFMSHV